MVYAIAHVRGGEEMGRAWYDDGRLLHKKNTFTDFIDVTDFLVKQGYAAPDRVAAYGGSAGGLLMGAIANMAPQDYRVIIAQVPFVDVVTTMLDASIPLTTNEYDEWGNPAVKKFYDYMAAVGGAVHFREQALRRLQARQVPGFRGAAHFLAPLVEGAARREPVAERADHFRLLRATAPAHRFFLLGAQGQQPALGGRIELHGR